MKQTSSSSPTSAAVDLRAIIARFPDTDVRSCLPHLLRLSQADRSRKASFLAHRALWIYSRAITPADEPVRLAEVDLSEDARILRVLATTQTTSIRRMLEDFGLTPAQILKSYDRPRDDTAGTVLAASLKFDKMEKSRARAEKRRADAIADGADLTARPIMKDEISALKAEIENLCFRLRELEARK